eukprot:Cvel_21617.t1-p1 / transcript=Cvel_21617.t1 / gene=Cvel_21617 / organism=Chromera_velia_CCMP2878 / gene_product=hypothetical protein / transcript_product=hypothetical protein / location=Cvel_scaffold2043:134-1950(-) / protein_length=208 / sequence_SO=supercontig / SO=protein_coding / is_pseudo=false
MPGLRFEDRDDDEFPPLWDALDLPDNMGALSVVMQLSQGSRGEEHKHHTLLLDKVTEQAHETAYAPADELNPRRILNCRTGKVNDITAGERRRLGRRRRRRRSSVKEYLVETHKVLSKAEREFMHQVALNKGSLMAPEEDPTSKCKWIAPSTTRGFGGFRGISGIFGRAVSAMRDRTLSAMRMEMKMGMEERGAKEGGEKEDDLELLE